MQVAGPWDKDVDTLPGMNAGGSYGTQARH